MNKDRKQLLLEVGSMLLCTDLFTLEKGVIIIILKIIGSQGGIFKDALHKYKTRAFKKNVCGGLNCRQQLLE